MASKKEFKTSIKVGMNSNEVKTSITNINKQMKVLDSDFRKYREQLKLSGNAQHKLGLESEFLKDKLKMQVKKVELLKDELRKTTEKYGENSKAVVNATVKLNSAETALYKLENRLVEVNEEINKNNKNFEHYAGKIVNVTSAVGTGAITVGKLGKEMFDLANNVSQATKEISQMAQITGMSTDAYQEWDYVLKQNSYSMEQAQGDLSALAEKAMDAAAGVGEGAELFGKLGVRVTETNGKLKSNEQIFNDVITALQGMTNETERNAIASALMSTTGEMLVPVLNMTTEELKKQKETAHELGVVLEEDAIQKGVDFAKTWEEARAVFGVAMQEIGVELLPMMGEAIQDLSMFLRENKTELSNMANMLGFTAGIIGGLLGLILKIPTPVLAGIAAFVGMVKVLTLLNTVIGATTGLSGLASMALGGLGIASKISASSILLIAGALAAVAVALALILGRANETEQAFANMDDTISNVVDVGNIESKIPGYAIGSRYIPQDHLAVVHEGEMIVPKKHNPYAGGDGKGLGTGGDTYNITISAKDVKEFNDIVRIAKGAKSNYRMGVLS